MCATLFTLNVCTVANADTVEGGLTDTEWENFRAALLALIMLEFAGHRPECYTGSTYAWFSNGWQRAMLALDDKRRSWDAFDGVNLVAWETPYEKTQRGRSITLTPRTAAVVRAYALLTARQPVEFLQEAQVANAEQQWLSALSDDVFVEDTLPGAGSFIFRFTDKGGARAERAPTSSAARAAMAHFVACV